MVSEARDLLEPPGAGADFDAFLSYTHRDRQVAVGVHKGLHQIGRRFGQLRALRVFRDDTNLEVSPDLWGKITEAMDGARYFVVVLSDLAAQSYWVNREIGYWLQQHGNDRVLLVLADGQLHWDADGQRFDPDLSSAAPPVLTEVGVLPAEPFFIDVSEDAPWDAHAAALREKVTALAAPIHGKNKDQLAGDDLREQRRFRRLRAAAIAGLTVLTIAAMVAAGFAIVQGREAIRQRNSAVALRLASDARAMLAGLQPGGDIQAFQELLAAESLGGTAVDGALHNALVDRISTVKAVQTSAEINAIALSPDGQRVVTGGDDGTAQLWDVHTGQRINGTPAHRGRVAEVAFSADGSRFATVGDDNHDPVRLWDGHTAVPTGQLEGNARQSVSFSSNGDIAAAGANGTIRLWDASGRPTGVLKVRDEQVTEVAFDPAGDRLLATDGRSVALFDVATRQPVSPLVTGHGATISGIAFSPDGTLFATAGDPDDASAVRVWDAATGQPSGKPFAGHDGAVNGVAFSPDGERLVSVGIDKSVRFWDVKTGAPQGKPLFGHERAIRAVVFSPDGPSVVTAGRDATWRVWNPDTGRIPTLHGAVTALAISPDGNRMASGSENGPVQLWDAHDGKPLWTLPGHRGRVRAVLFSRDGRRLISGGQDDTVRFWNTDTGRPEGDPRDAHQEAVASATLSRDGHLLVTGGNDGSVQLWDADSGQPRGARVTPNDRPGHESSIAVSPDGRHVASVGTLDGIRVWDVDPLRPLGDAFGHAVHSVAYSPDGRLIASGGDDGTVQLWDSNSHKPVRAPMNPYQGMVTDRVTPGIASLAFTPDGAYLFTGGFDKMFRLWRVDDGRPIGDAISADSALQVSTVAAFPDSRYAASAGADGMIKIWPLRSPDLLCAKLASRMSPAQWHDWVLPDVPYHTTCPDLPASN